MTHCTGLMLVGSVVAGLAVSGCGGTEVTTDPTRRDGGSPVERERSPDSGVHLTLIDQQEIATSGLITMRPDVARTARGTYLGVTANAPTPRHAFDVFALDSALSSVRSTKIIASDASGSGEVAITGMPTDLRVASDGADVVWCALETALIASAGSTCKNCLNVAAYRDTSGTLTLAAHQEVECVSVTCPEAGGQLPTFPAGSIMTNDPAPLAYGGKYYVMLHQYGASGLGYAPTPIQVVKVFDASFTEEPSFTLDLGTALGSSSPGTYALVTIQGSPWLIGSAYSGPPCGSCASPPTADGSAYLFAIQLSPDLKATVGSAVTLSQTKTYQHYVTGARYAEGKLYVTHNVEGNAPGSYPKGVLKVFDVSHGFAELEDITINQSVAGMDGVGYNHITVEVIAGKVYAFFPQPTKIPENTVGVKVFEWR